MSSSAPPPLLSAAGAGAGQPPSRSASCAVAKPTRGFHVFRIDGYSWSKALPAGERITSAEFTVGGHRFHVDYYPNGTAGGGDDGDGESDAISLYLRVLPDDADDSDDDDDDDDGRKRRVRAEYKFSLLDAAGDAAYELPAETAVFPGAVAGRGRGYAAFIAKTELERRRDSLLRDDRLVVRCDVGVAEVVDMAVEVESTKRHGGHGRLRSRSSDSSSSDSSDDDDDDVALPGKRGRGRQQQPPPDDKEYIRRCLAAKRRRR